MTLAGQDYVKILPVVGAAAALVYFVVKNLRGDGGGGSGKVNQSIMKDQAKVATMVDVEELGEKTCYCRCWRSSKFPLCDGSHTKHNQETGDNVGPLVVKKKQ